MLPNKQSAKGATFALLATMLRGWFQETMDPCIRKKKFHRAIAAVAVCVLIAALVVFLVFVILELKEGI